jgi:hypothetical protein
MRPNRIENSAKIRWARANLTGGRGEGRFHALKPVTGGAVMIGIEIDDDGMRNGFTDLIGVTRTISMRVKG